MLVRGNELCDEEQFYMAKRVQAPAEFLQVVR